MNKQKLIIKREEVIVSAPASIANLGCLFDIAAMAVNYGRDIVKVMVKRGIGIRKGIQVTSRDPRVPSGKRNTAYRTVETFLHRVGLPVQEVVINVEVIKGIEPGIGLGSSGATSAAVAKALNEIFGEPLSSNELVEIAGQGEIVAAGSVHYDNVAASLLGGIAVIVQRSPIKVIKFDPPSDISILLITPKNVNVPFKSGKTGFFRKILPSKVDLSEMIEQCTATSEFLIALMTRDLEMLGRAMSRGGIVERERSKFIPDYWEIKEIVLKSGALGFNIAGAGPSMFALIRKSECVQVINMVKSGLNRLGIKVELKLLEPELVGARLELQTKSSRS